MAKILGVLVGATALSLDLGALAIAAAMALGGILAARRVAETLAHRLTPMTPGQGLAANLVTSLLVSAASPLGLPVSTHMYRPAGSWGSDSPAASCAGASRCRWSRHGSSHCRLLWH